MKGLKFPVKIWCGHSSTNNPEKKYRIYEGAGHRPTMVVDFNGWRYFVDMLDLERSGVPLRLPTKGEPSIEIWWSMVDGKISTYWVEAEGCKFELPLYYISRRSSPPKAVILNPSLFTNLGHYMEGLEQEKHMVFLELGTRSKRRQGDKFGREANVQQQAYVTYRERVLGKSRFDQSGIRRIMARLRKEGKIK